MATVPEPPVINAGTASTQEQPGRPPSDAIVLFDGKGHLPLANRQEWASGLEGQGRRSTVIKPGRGRSHLQRRVWRLPAPSGIRQQPVPPRGRDQGRGNSGVMLFGRYDLQVLDSYQSVTYADGQAAAIYGQYPPLVNATREPGQWQTYDIIFTAPRFRQDGALESPAFVTMLHNGVLVHNHTSILGPMAFRSQPRSTPNRMGRGRSSCKTTVTLSGSATSGSARSKVTTNLDRGSCPPGDHP